VTKKIVTVAFPIIEPLTVLMVALSFIFLHNSAVSDGSIKYFKKFFKLNYFMKYFKRK